MSARHTGDKTQPELGPGTFHQPHGSVWALPSLFSHWGKCSSQHRCRLSPDQCGWKALPVGPWKAFVTDRLVPRAWDTWHEREAALISREGKHGGAVFLLSYHGDRTVAQEMMVTPCDTHTRLQPLNNLPRGSDCGTGFEWPSRRLAHDCSQIRARSSKLAKHLPVLVCSLLWFQAAGARHLSRHCSQHQGEFLQQAPGSARPQRFKLISKKGAFPSSGKGSRSWWGRESGMSFGPRRG